MTLVDTVTGGRVPSITPMATRRPRVMLLFIAFAIIATLAHVCTLPGHIHAAELDTADHSHDVRPSDHSDAPDDSAYGESCDALRPGSSPAPPVVFIELPTSTALVFERLEVRSRTAAVVTSRASPPLYVVHRALLI